MAPRDQPLIGLAGSHPHAKAFTLLRTVAALTLTVSRFALLGLPQTFLYRSLAR
jgi:hypothetical protein